MYEQKSFKGSLNKIPLPSPMFIPINSWLSSNKIGPPEFSEQVWLMIFSFIFSIIPYDFIQLASFK